MVTETNQHLKKLPKLPKEKLKDYSGRPAVPSEEGFKRAYKEAHGRLPPTGLYEQIYGETLNKYYRKIPSPNPIEEAPVSIEPITEAPLPEGAVPFAPMETIPSPPPPLEIGDGGFIPIRGLPEFDVKKIADLYKIPSPLFVTNPQQLEDLKLPPEEYGARWKIAWEQYLTWEQAKYIGLDVPEGSVVKMTPMAGGEPEFTLLEQQKPPQIEADLEEVLRDVYPEWFKPGESYGFTPEQLPQMALQNIQGWMQSDFQGFVKDLYSRIGEFAGDVVLRRLGVTGEISLQALEQDEQNKKVLSIAQTLFPEYDSLDQFADFVNDNWGTFIETIQTGGDSYEKRQLLEVMGVKPDAINDILGTQRIVMDVEGIRKLVIKTSDNNVYDRDGNWLGFYDAGTKGIFNPYPKQPKGFIGKAGRSFIAGIGDVFQTSGGTARWLGFEDAGTTLSSMGSELQRYGVPSTTGEFDWWDVLNPDFWVTKVTRTLPFALAIAPVAIGGFYGSGALASALGVGRIATMVISSLSSAAMSRSIESALEAGGQYDDALARGKTEKEAKEEANQVFINNMKLAGMDAWEIGIALAPTPKWIPAQLVKSGLVRTARIGGKMIIVGLSEGGEEVYQDMITRHARGEEWKLDPISKEVFAIGAAMGVGMGLGGDVIQSIVNQSVPKLPPSLKVQFDEAVSKARGEGLNQQEAQVKALDTIVQLPEGKNIVQKAINRINEAIKQGKEFPEAGFTIPFGKGEEVTREYAELKDVSDALGRTQVDWVEVTGSRGRHYKVTTPEGKYDVQLVGWVKGTSKGKWQVTLEPVTPTAPAVEMPPSTAVQTGLAGMGVEAAQAEMFAEVSGKEGRKVPLTGVPKTQEVLEGQLKLEQARKAAEEAPPEVKEAYEAQAQVEGLKYTHEVDPVLQPRFQLGGKNVDLTAFISIREGQFPDTLTVKQAKAIKPFGNFTPYEQKGTAKYNKVPVFEVLDELADKWGMTTDQVVDRINQIAKEKRQIKQLESDIKKQMTERPLPAVRELTTEEVAEQWQMMGQPRYNMEQINALVEPFAQYVMNPSVVTAYELARQTLALQRSERFNNLKAKLAEIKVQTGEVTEEQARQIITDTLSGKYWVEMTDYLQFITEELRHAHFAKVAHVLTDYPAEYAGTITALVNALDGRPIPNVRPTPPPGGFKSRLWPQGASALDKLQYVFGKGTRHMKALEKMAAEEKPLEDVVKGVFHETGRDPIPIDAETAEYLRKLSDIPNGYKTLLEPPFDYPTVTDLRSPRELAWAKMEVELSKLFADGTLTLDEYQIERMQARDTIWKPEPVAKFEAPIEDAFRQGQMWTSGGKQMLVRVLKEIGLSPVDIGNFLRANKSSFDNSFLRQSKVLASGHPLVGFEAHTTAWQSMFSQKHAEAEWQQITRAPRYEMYERLRQERGADPLRVPAFANEKGTARYRRAEEYGFPTLERLIPRLTAKIPWVKLSERGFSAGTNKIVWRLWNMKYDSLMREAEKVASGQVKLKAGEVVDIVKELGDFQAFLADAIQRADLGKFKEAAPIFSSVFFALRSKLGRFFFPRHLLGITVRQGKVGFNPRIMGEAWRDFIAMIALWGGLVFLADWLGIGDAEDDPRNAEFGSLRIGNTRIDPWAGYRQFVVLYARLVTGTGISSVTGAEYEVNKIGALTNFVRGSLAPMTSILLDFWTGRNFLGEVVEITNAREWLKRVLSFSIVDVWEAMEENQKVGALMVVPAIYGEGVQTYTGDWVDNWKKLGLPKFAENTAYGIFAPPYDTADFWADTASQFKGVDPATLTKEKGFPDYIRAIVETKRIQEHLATLPSERLVSLNADPAKGVIFSELRDLWTQRQALVDAGDKAEFVEDELQPDGKYKKVTHKGDDAVTAFDKHEFSFRGITIKGSQAYNGNFSQRQFALLNEYWSITDKKKQADFLKQHEAEIGVKARDEYLRSHPKENAQLAIWGQAKILTKEAYNQFKSMVKTLDIPGNALPKLTLPPETLLDTHWKYEEMVSEGKHGSWEAQLLLKQDALKAKEGKVQSYVDWRTKEGEQLTLSDTPIASLELKVKNHENLDLIDSQSKTGYGNPDSPNYIANEKYRKAAILKLRQTKVDGETTLADVERKIKALEKGTDEAPTDEKLVSSHLEYGKLIDQEGVGSSSAEVMLYRVDNPEYNKWRLDKDIWGNDAFTEDVDQSRIPIWRIDVKYAKEDEEYNAIKHGLPAEQARLRAEYMAGHDDYRKDSRRRDAYTLTNSETGEKFPTGQLENYVNYYEIPAKGFRQERFLVENPDFADAMHGIKGMDLPTKVPSVQYDDIYDEYPDEFDKLSGLADNTSQFYIEDVKQRELTRKAMRFTNGKYNEFGLAEIKREAYGKFVPDEEVDNYVGYYQILGEKTGRDYRTDLWYEEDWFLMENKDFYQNVYLKILGNERKDFGKVPSRDVFKQYLRYLDTQEGKPRDDFRWTHRDLDAWLVKAFDYTPITEKKRREELTPLERVKEGIWKWDIDTEKKLKEIEELLGRLK